MSKRKIISEEYFCNMKRTLKIHGNYCISKISATKHLDQIKQRLLAEGIQVELTIIKGLVNKKIDTTYILELQNKRDVSH